MDSRLDCSSEYDWDYSGSVHRYNGFYGWNIDDRPVPSEVFNYDVNTNIEANPIPSLWAVWGISLPLLVLSAVTVLMVKVRNFLCSSGQRILLLLIGDYFMGDLKPWRAFYLLHYKTS